MKNMLKIIRKGVTQWALAKISARYAGPWTVISEMSFMQTVFFANSLREKIVLTSLVGSSTK